MKHFRKNQLVRINAKGIQSRFGIIKEEIFPGLYAIKVGCKYDRDRSLLFIYASEVDGSRLVMLGEEYLKAI